MHLTTGACVEKLRQHYSSKMKAKIKNHEKSYDGVFLR
jgi:hypothetical protein